MEDSLRKLNFLPTEYLPGVMGFYKIYMPESGGAFTLFVGSIFVKGLYVCSIVVGKLEISVPGFIDEAWITQFDTENIK